MQEPQAFPLQAVRQLAGPEGQQQVSVAQQEPLAWQQSAERQPAAQEVLAVAAVVPDVPPLPSAA